MTLSSAAQELTVSLVDSVDDVGSDAWSALYRASRAPVFYSYDFLRSVERAPLSTPSRAGYLLAHDRGNRLVAALPLYLQETRDPFGAADAGPVRALLSHVWHCYDTVLPSAVPLTTDLVGRFWDATEDLAARSGAGLWGLVNVAMSGPLADGLAAAGVALEPTVARYRLPIEGRLTSVEEHLATIGRSSRRTLRRYRRQARDAGAVITVEEGRSVLDRAVLDLCLATADKHAPGYYPPDALAALIEALGPNCRIIRVELDGVLLAASICLVDSGRLHAWAGGCRYPAELKWSPQYVLFAAELEAGFAIGLPTLECGRRNDEFKTRYGLQPLPLGRAVRRRGA
jgi:predicted N-acyltransferase